MLIYGVRESRTTNEVVVNLLELHRMANGSAEEKAFHRARIKNATHQIAFRHGSDWVFAPVKWCGARKNSIHGYAANKEPVTDQFKPVIMTAGFLPITKDDAGHDDLYRAYVAYCARYGFTHSDTVDARTFYVQNGDGDEPSLDPEAVDIHEPAGRNDVTVSRIIRDTPMARRIKRLHNYECQICGLALKLADGSGYAEAHHIQPLGRPHHGPDVSENIICLCPNHHVEMDYGVLTLDRKEVREAEGHRLGDKFIDYHNSHIVCGANTLNRGA